MELFDRVKCIDPSQFTMRLTPRKFMETYAPAYGNSWDEVRDSLLDNPADHSVILELARQHDKYGEFRELPVVSLPQCDIEDREECPARVANGMHRISVLRAKGKIIDFSLFRPDFPAEDEWTDVKLTFQDKIIDDDDLFDWLRSIPLENGDWVECYMGTQDGYVFSLYLDKVLDHKVILKKLHQLATTDVFARYGLLSISITDKKGSDEE